MNKKNRIVVVLAVFIGIIVRLLFSLNKHNEATPATVAENPTVDTSAPTMPAPDASNFPNPAPNPAPRPPEVVANKQILPPTVPPAQPQDPATPTAVSDNPPIATLTDEETKAIRNNLRQLVSAGNSYMLDKGVTEVGYTDIVGTGTDNYIHAITPVAGEDYEDFTIEISQTQVSTIAPDGTEVIFEN